MAGVGRKYSGPMLKTAFLKPKMMDEVKAVSHRSIAGSEEAAARIQHRLLLENYSSEEASNVAAYLAAMK